MTKAQLISKMERVQELLNDIAEWDIDELISSNYEKIELIEEKAYERESGENTEKEQEKIDDLNALNENLEALKDELNFDIEYLIQQYLED